MNGTSGRRSAELLETMLPPHQLGASHHWHADIPPLLDYKLQHRKLWEPRNHPAVSSALNPADPDSYPGRSRGSANVVGVTIGGSGSSFKYSL